LNLPLWHEIGRRQQAGRVSLYRGPLLLAYDQRHNAFDDAHIPLVDVNRLELVAKPADWLMADLPGLRLCDYASAGFSGTFYRSWLHATNLPPQPVKVLKEILVAMTNAVETHGTNLVSFDIEEWPEGDYSLSLRVMMLSPPPKGIGQIFSAWCRGMDDPLRIVVDPASKVYARIEAGRGWSTQGVTIESNRWYRIAAVKKGASLQLYLDGKAVAHSDAPPDIASDSKRVALGGNPLYRGAPEYLAARFGDLKVYSRALRADELGN
jgi:hypothetical protein